MANAIKLASGRKRTHWKPIPVKREILDLRSVLDISFKHVKQLASGMADFLAKIGVERDQAVVDFLTECSVCGLYLWVVLADSFACVLGSGLGTFYLWDFFWGV